MHAEEARQLLGFPPNFNPNPSQVKAAYKKKVWDHHPDRFPSTEKPLAESQFKSITEAYSLLLSGVRHGHGSSSASYTTRVVRTGVPNVHGGRRNRALSSIPFLIIVFGAFGLGGLNAARAYNKEKGAHASNNPFLEETIYAFFSFLNVHHQKVSSVLALHCKLGG